MILALLHSADTNWFYSSLSQSAAALIGLIGAIMATRLDGQIREARKARAEFDNLVVASCSKVEELWVNVPRQGAQLEALLASLESLRKASNLNDLRKAADQLVKSTKGNPTWENRGAVIHRDVGMASGAHGELRRKADSRVYERLLVVLALLSSFGLLGPLFFLQARAGWSKWVLLAGFTLGVLGLLGYIGYQVRYLRRIRTRALMFDR